MLGVIEGSLTAAVGGLNGGAVDTVLSAGGCGLGEESTVLAWPRMDRTSPRTVISIARRCSAVS